MGRLTDAALRNWIREGKPLAGKADGDGLTFTISVAGRATWVLRYRYCGKPKAMTLGTYPAMSLAIAREAAREQRVALDRGSDPLRMRKAERAAVRGRKTFNELADSYLAREGASLAPGTLDDNTRHLKKDVRPKLGAKEVAEITKADIVDMLEEVQKRTDSVARRIFELLQVVFKHAVARGMIEQSPMLGLSMKAVLGKAPAVRKRIALTDEELRAMLAALPRAGRQNALAIRILLATCARKSELAKARTSDVDLKAGRWTIPDENAKTGSGMIVPIAPTVAEWFGELMENAKLLGSPWVLPGIDPRNHISDSTINAALDRMEFDGRRFNVHDLRSTARSHLGKLGVDIIIAERCLGHSLGGLVAVYDVGDYWEERKAALELWARHLEALKKPVAPNVVPFTPRAA